MKIAIGNDHVGVELKRHLMEYLSTKGHEVVNFGTDVPGSTHYPIFAARVSKAVLSGEFDLGVLVCGTGMGISMAANKIKGIRCAVCNEPVTARLARQHNNANIVAVGARMIGPVMAEAIVDEFLASQFQGGRHQLRIDMMTKLENGEPVE